MRRADREIKEYQEVIKVLEKCNTLHLAMQGKDYPYVVPVSFGMKVENHQVTIYFHCAKAGMKVDLLQADPNVCFEGEIFHCYEATAHGITTRYESIIGFGKCTEVLEQSEILDGLERVCTHCGYQDYPVDRCKGLDHLKIYKIEVESMTGKRNLPEAAQ